MTGSEPATTPPPLWNAEEIARAVSGRVLGGFSANGVSIDSRKVRPGDLFVAIRGPRFDGHAYVRQALDAGAAGVMVSDEDGLPGPTVPGVVTDDTLSALTALGRAARARSSARLVAVTGSVGKTGTKEALGRALAPQVATHASEGNLNNEIGLPLSLARMPAETGCGVFELGMNRAGEIGRLSQLLGPDVAVITEIAPAHTAFLDGAEGVARAKAEIFDGMSAAGTAILNRDNAFWPLLCQLADARGIGRIVGFGSHSEADARLITCRPDARGSAVTAEITGRRLDYMIGAPGRHWVINSLAVLAAVDALGMDVEAAAAALDKVEAPPGRGRRIAASWDRGTIEIIDESYNASPLAVHAALQVLGGTTPAGEGRRIAVLGDMKELGPDETIHHEGLVEPLRRHADLVFTIGPLMRGVAALLGPQTRHHETLDTLEADLHGALRAGDVVMVKGSLSMGLGPLVARLAAGPAAAGDRMSPATG